MVPNHSIVGPMVDNHRKPSLPMVVWPKNHQKTIVPNGYLQPFHSMVMVLLKPLKLFDGTRNLPFSSNCSKNFKKYSGQHLNFEQCLQCLQKQPKHLLRTVGEFQKSEQRRFCPFSMILTIDNHRTQNLENHRKTIISNGLPGKKHLMVMVGRWQNHWKTIGGNGALKK